MAPMRPVVLSSGSGGTSSNAPPRAEPRPRRATTPGGIEAPTMEAALAAKNGLLPPPGPTTSTHVPPAAPLFGSRPPPGAGSYSVSSSHPPPFDGVGTTSRTTVERLSPLQSQRPPSGAAPTTVQEPVAVAQTAIDTGAPQIMSRPPALDPEAETWASHFEAPPPAIEPAPPTRPIGTAPPTPPAEAEPAPRRGGAGRWKTQVMGSMVPLEVSEAREAPRPLSEPPSRSGYDAQLVAGRQAPTPAASTLVHHDVPDGWAPNVDATDPHVVALRDAIMSQGLSRHLRIAVTGSPGAGKARVAGALAVALSQSGARVLLVEADFDQPQVHQVMALAAPSGAGFSQQIIARRNDAQARPWAVIRCSQTLQALCEGRLRSPGMLASEEFERAIQQLGDQHHVLIMHAPSLDRHGDLRPVDALSHAAIFVTSKEQPGIHFGHNPLREHLQ
jgi:Mrp family chromosome partitioning ATPase